MNRPQLEVVGAVFCLAAGAVLGHFFLTSNLFPPAATPDAIEDSSHSKLINPLLFCQDQDISNFTNAISNEIDNKLRAYINTQEGNGHLAEASVYYKDLNEGPWVLIDNTMKTVPASLLKVPTAIAIYKHAESAPAFLEKTFELPASNTLNQTQYFKPPQMTELGQKYTIEQLVNFMLKDSDNAALYLLGTSLDQNEFTQIYNDLGVAVPSEPAPGYTIDARTYASFFRVLYNASYLSQNDSEHVLETLSHSDFPEGIRSGVPQGTTVADKFGEYTVSSSDLRLNDCGIVYRAHEPYILCVLVRGDNFDSLAQTIAGISSTVWGVLDEQN